VLYGNLMRLRPGAWGSGALGADEGREGVRGGGWGLFYSLVVGGVGVFRLGGWLDGSAHYACAREYEPLQKHGGSHSRDGCVIGRVLVW